MQRYKAVGFKVFLPLIALLLGACGSNTPGNGGNTPTFTISLNPTSLTINQGSSGQTTLTVTPKNGFSGTVSLSLVKQDGSAAPNGITLKPTSVNVSGSNPVNQALTIEVKSSVQAGTYSLKVRAASGNITKEASLSLMVNQALGSYTLSGTVISEGAGGPVAGSTVRLFMGTTQVAADTTDDQGRFSFASLPQGTFRLEAQKEGMAGSVVEGIQVPKISSITLIQKPAFDRSLPTTPPALRITQDGTNPLAGQTFTDTIPFRVQVDSSSDHVKPMRFIYVALGRTPGSAFLTATTTSGRLIFPDTEDTGNQVLSGSAVAGLGDEDGEEVYLEVVAYDFNNNRSHYLLPLTFKNTNPAQENSVEAPQGVAATAITLGQAVGFYSVKAPLGLKVPLGRGLFGELSIDPQAAPPESNLYVEIRWCYTNTSASPFAFDIERSTDGQNWTRVGTVGGGASSSCPSNPFNRPFYFRDASADLSPGQTYHYRVVARGANQEASEPSSTTPLPPFSAPLLSPLDEATGVSKTPDFTIGHPQLEIGADGAAYNLVLWDTLTGSEPAWVTLLGYPLFVEFGTGTRIPQGQALVYGFDPYTGEHVYYTDTAGLRDPSKPNRVLVDVDQGTVTLPYNFDGFAALPSLQALRTYAWGLYVSYAYKYEGDRIGAYSIRINLLLTDIPIIESETQVFEFTTGE